LTGRTLRADGPLEVGDDLLDDAVENASKDDVADTVTERVSDWRERFCHISLLR
jgi:hypothetical protein